MSMAYQAPLGKPAGKFFTSMQVTRGAFEELPGDSRTTHLIYLDQAYTFLNVRCDQHR